MSYLLADRLCWDQLTDLEFNWEKEGRRQEEIAEHKLNKQINSVTSYNQNKIEHDLFFLLACVSCEGVLIFFFFLTLQHNMRSLANSYFSQWVILNKIVD